MLLTVGLAMTTCMHIDALQLTLNAESAILMNAETGTLLFEKNADKLQFPASTTKIATALYALHQKQGELDTLIAAEHDSVASITEAEKKRSNYTLPAYWHEPGGSHIGIKKGEEMTLRDLLYGMMIASGNDASNVIAQHVGGTIPNFMKDMNEYLKRIGCKNTTFYNPHGLYFPKHQTTAIDMAIMTREALKNPFFRKIVSTVRYPRPKTNKQESTILVQTNRLLKPSSRFYYPKAIGVKTGYTSKSGHNLVAAAKHEDRVLIAVLLHASDREQLFLDAIKLFDTAFNQPKVQRVLYLSGPQSYTLQLEGGEKPIKTILNEDVSIEYYQGEEPIIQCWLCWKAVTPPIVKGQQVGEIKIESNDGHTKRTIPLLAQENVEATKWWLISKFFANSKNSWWIKGGVIGLLLLFFGGLGLRLRKKA